MHLKHYAVVLTMHFETQHTGFAKALQIINTLTLKGHYNIPFKI